MHVAQDMLPTVPAAVLAPRSLLRLALRGADVRAVPSSRAPAVARFRLAQMHGETRRSALPVTYEGREFRRANSVAQMVTETRVEQPTTTLGATRSPTSATGRSERTSPRRHNCLLSCCKRFIVTKSPIRRGSARRTLSKIAGPQLQSPTCRGPARRTLSTIAAPWLQTAATLYRQLRVHLSTLRDHTATDSEGFQDSASPSNSVRTNWQT